MLDVGESTQHPTSYIQHLPRSGVGDTYLSLRFTTSRHAVSFVTFVSVVAPTADRAEGFSTGHVTYDWNNHLYRSVGPLTPFANTRAVSGF
jgi:hypothetical protein